MRNRINLVLSLFALLATVMPAAAEDWFHHHHGGPHAAPAPVIGVGLVAVAATAGALIFSRKFFRKR